VDKRVNEIKKKYQVSTHKRTSSQTTEKKENYVKPKREEAKDI